jgi:ribosome-associated protein
MKIDVSKEISFKTARSGGKGGQNVNKVETMVEAYFQVAESRLLEVQQKEIILTKLASKINSEGFLMVKCQEYRTQLQNKERAVEKLNALLEASLKRKKFRIATQVSKAAKIKRVESKKKKAEHKKLRRKVKPNEY